MLDGIPPEKLFLDISKVKSFFISPIFHGISPPKAFFDKFNAISPWRLVSSYGNCPVRLLLDRSMILSNPRMLLNSRTFPCHSIVAWSKYE
ncbi:hypothetical protein HanPI659440_Chr02g0091111 [Helianthus annuus]|nr:hypothetical protein HanPI659440_Chr02g0091111 [Helianthus annuus]